MVEIVPATPEIVAEFYHGPLGMSVYAIAAQEDGKTLGVAGFYLTRNGAVVFAEISDALREMPRVLIKGARRLFAVLAKKNLLVVAKCDESIEAAERFLEHFGFVRMKGDLFVWQRT